MVGDADLDANLQALVRATREAVANAARHSEAPSVDVYAEVVDGQVEVFVRDRGVGFDPAAVPDDRMGLKGSVIGRVERHGGTARVRSTPGEGAEVALTMKVGHGAPNARRRHERHRVRAGAGRDRRRPRHVPQRRARRGSATACRSSARPRTCRRRSR
ncbi:hypothetical protein GCM10025868_34290 [Angustibacter aerolatus]|uniref:Histidine kinase/HSP90-like ATPase domain-containing protein n=1 Tax=Angustibacter aerolatus TaxID=1162965 RepID=A0ABQ6JLF8_9ACTN|nr:hypothetical protein GCM10025868_34290 [Angustibacter aerolatus]